MSLVEVKYNAPLANLVINRPKALNALSEDVLVELVDTLGGIKAHSEIQVVLLTGAGDKAFVAGADIQVMSQYSDKEIADYVELGGRVMRAIETFPLPVIAVINGFALGGGLELALACDLIVASDTARIGQPEVNLGIIPGFGATQRLVARAGVGTAKRLCFTGEVITAEEGHALGIVDYVLSSDSLFEGAQRIGENIASKAPLAIRKCKKVIHRAGQETLLAGLRTEVESFIELFSTLDRQEGMNAFLEKRAPKFDGK